MFLSEHELKKIVRELQDVLGDEVLALLKAGGLQPDDMLRFMPIALGCKTVRQQKKLTIAQAARALNIRQYHLKHIEAGLVLKIQPGVLTRYVVSLGLTDFFNAWAAAHPKLADQLARNSNRGLKTGGSPPAASTLNSTVYQLKITLKDSQPPIWRRIQVPANLTLQDLHQVLQLVMGWSDSHLHQFVVRGDYFGVPDPEYHQPVEDERKIRLCDLGLSPQNRFSYEYDFGDGWDHQVVLEKVMDAPAELAPVCVAGERACPMEDSGGMWGYQENLEILRNPQHPQYAETREWMGTDFDPEAFDLEQINCCLFSWHRQRKKPRRRKAK